MVRVPPPRLPTSSGWSHKSTIFLLFLFASSFSSAASQQDSYSVAEKDSTTSYHTAESTSCVVSNDDSGASSCLEGNIVHCQDDDPEICEIRGLTNDCDKDPSWMLEHCRKTCSICLVGTKKASTMPLEQNAGFGKLPFDVSIQVLQVIRKTNVYYQTIANATYALVNESSSCRDQQAMCAFWAFRGQCDSAEYATYMDRECPLTCQQCSTNLRMGHAFLQFLLGNLMDAYNTDSGDFPNPTNSERDVVASRHRSLSLLMSTIGMDPSLLGKQLMEEDGNWLETLHERLYALIPLALLKLYRSENRDMTKDDFELLTSLHGLEDGADRRKVLTNILMPYRSRGSIVSIMRDVDHLITRPIQLGIGFAVPNEASLVKIEDFVGGNDSDSIVQMGVGAGYWAAVLRRRGVNVLAYDLHPPWRSTNGTNDDDASNVFFDVTYANNIHQGSCTTVFGSNPQIAKERALLLIWPNDPDPVDNVEFCGDGECKGSEPVWDADCLLSYLEAGGRKVIYVGERESQIRVRKSALSGDCGISSTRRFQQLLNEHFSLVDEIRIPNWWLNEDDVTMWKRRSA